MSNVIFDIETGSIPDEELESLFAWDEKTIPNYDMIGSEFDETTVKVSNLKDQAKIEAKINEARDKFYELRGIAERALSVGRDIAFEAFKAKAALSPFTGQVLAVGFYEDDVHIPYDCPNNKKIKMPYITSQKQGSNNNEYDVLFDTFAKIESVLESGDRLIGHNIINFDLPFLCKRALKHNIVLPQILLNEMRQYQSKVIIDTMREWSFGSRTEKFVSLDDLAAFFGTRRKNGDGADFAKLFWSDDPSEVKTAIEYLENDVIMTLEIARKMGILQ
jgi:hypothetical protein